MGRGLRRDKGRANTCKSPSAKLANYAAMILYVATLETE